MFFDVSIPRHRRRWITALVAIAIVASLWTTAPRWLAAIGGWLDVGQPPRHADAAWILNGDIDSRPFEAAMLYRDKLVDRIIVTSVPERQSSHQSFRSHHELTIDILQKCGVQSRDIDLIDARVESTYDEAVAVSGWLASDEARTVIVVTNDYHTRRTRWIFRKTIDVFDRVAFVSAQPEGFGAANWWRHQDGFTLYLAELIKFPIYMVLYSRLVWFSASFLVLVAMVVSWQRDRI